MNIRNTSQKGNYFIFFDLLQYTRSTKQRDPLISKIFDTIKTSREDFEDLRPYCHKLIVALVIVQLSQPSNNNVIKN